MEGEGGASGVCVYVCLWGGGGHPLWLITLFKEPAPPNHLPGSTLQTSSATRDHTSTSPSVPRLHFFTIRLRTHEPHMQPTQRMWENR